MVAFGQNAQVSGLIRDPMHAAVPRASVTFENLATHEKTQTTSNGEGIYALPSLPPGHYDLTVEAPGFEIQRIHDFTASVAAKASLDITLKVGGDTQSVSVDAGSAQMNTVDASVSTVIDHKFVENLPLNGRSFQSLLTLVPGVISVPSSGSGVSGQIAVNGMRSESNYFLIDGVSANTGVNNTSPGRGAGYSGSLPSSTALGTTQSLISIDALEEFRGTTSTYSAENGRVPGGQFSFRTRSGTSDFHGTVYDYFRNDAMDANSYFNNRNKIGRVKMRQNDFGGTFGGPILLPGLLHRRDRSFFFYSYEGLRLSAPQEATTTYVPTPELIAEAPSVLHPILNAFPKPNAGSLAAAGKLTSYTASYSQPSRIDAHSLRLDHALTDGWRIFGRFAYTPSSTRARYSSNLAQVNDTAVNSKTLTLGSTNMFSPLLTNELRFNLSWNDQITSSFMDTFGGATPMKITDLAGLSAKDWALFAYRPSVSAGFWLNPQNNRQKQYNAVDTLT
ncbi:MAG TPA: TonB-dependent receptor [Edaphobacter sp.]|nr:TonB-dependent receptor [Edaphobacter sp.]